MSPSQDSTITSSQTHTDNTISSTLFDPIESCISAFKRGEFLVVLDSPDRENEGDLIISASTITPQQMSFMVRHTSGIICTPLSPSICESLELPQMIPAGANSDPNRTAYTISVDSNHETVTTGISAYDRALTCNELARKSTHPGDFRRPGHIFPLRARPGGVRERMGHTEAAVEFCRLADMREAGVISELVEVGSEVQGQAVLNGADSMLRTDGCLEFARKFGLKICTIEDLKEFVERTEGKLEMGKVNGHVH
ncbi:3,4-dihydroxy 2-butanone 4-phosphate synthase [Neophaeococcomyces mojaviensis]|uniref:3,4-dihydroxy 2-butanone 4-phosphate synthase n=1 Tax=Neophaeococcomyces mojaviensis TaxID=3383035 RepID=A0ACC3A098_9EURO|nr:3,4-dihydroxy 2-butanone 4-phosphate synthase [Knufia sp. JES_112]